MKRFIVMGLMVGACIAAEPEKKTRDQMVLEDRAALTENETWVYNDLEKAYAEAERTKRPLMVIHRCIP
ncbi:MAG: serine protease Do [Verrucomicrobiales bacterium]|jgi:serine protease Do